MVISTVNYHETIFEHPNLTKIIGIPTYDALHLLHNEIKSNAISVHSNIGGVQHGYLGLVVSPTACALLSNSPFVPPINPGILSIPVVVTCNTHDELKRQYDKNIQLFHEMWGVERAIVQKLILAIKAKYITDIRNRTTGKFYGTLFMSTQYTIVTYGKISPSQLIDLNQDTK